MIDNNTMDLGVDGGTGMEGTTWWKKDGSDHFKVREVLMVDAGFSIRTDDGRLIPGDEIENYIQSDIPITGKEGMQPHTPKIDISQLDGLDSTAIVHDESEVETKDFGSLRFSHPDAKFKPDTRMRMIRKEPDPINDPLDAKPVAYGEEGRQGVDGISYGMIDRVLGNVPMDTLTGMNINHIDKVDNGVVILTDTLNIKRSEIKEYMRHRIIEKFEDIINQALDFYLNSLGISDDESNPDSEISTKK